MINSLRFQKYRGFSDLTISPLKRVNLIAGANNTGKTGILEGLYLLFGDGSQVPVLPSVFRSNVSGQPNQPTADDFPTFWESLFHDKNTSLIPQVSATTPAPVTFKNLLTGDSTAPRHSYEFRLEIDGTKSSIFLLYGETAAKYVSNQVRVRSQEGGLGGFQIGQQGSAGRGFNPHATRFIVLSTRLEHPARDAELFNQVSLLQGGEERLISLLREVDPRLDKLRYLKAPGTNQALVYAHFGLKNAISMTQTGQGFSKLFSLFCQMLVSKAEFLFIDEIENGLYYESLPVIWKGISALAASEEIQVFATTHSRECIVAAHETFTTTPEYGFALHRLQRVKGSIEVVTHDQQMLDVAIKAGMEVR